MRFYIEENLSERSIPFSSNLIQGVYVIKPDYLISNGQKNLTQDDKAPSPFDTCNTIQALADEWSKDNGLMLYRHNKKIDQTRAKYIFGALEN
ncbi:MAG: hypothetical protein ACT4OY_08885 [Alphaproteobacteria bacterium]